MEYIRGALSWVDLSIEQLIITLLIVVVYLLHKELKLVRYQFAQLDKLVFAHALIISNKLGVKTIKLHRSSDYEVAQPINNLDD